MKILDKLSREYLPSFDRLNNPDLSDNALAYRAGFRKARELALKCVNECSSPSSD